jgi:hypothetical protein
MGCREHICKNTGSFLNTLIIIDLSRGAVNLGVRFNVAVAVKHMDTYNFSFLYSLIPTDR